MAFVVLPITDAMIRKTRLPNGAALLHPEGESSFDELHGSLQGDFFRGSEQHVDVVGHDDEFMEQEFSCIAIVREGVNQKSCGRFAAEDWKALEGDGGDEEHALAVHCVIFA